MSARSRSISGASNPVTETSNPSAGKKIGQLAELDRQDFPVPASLRCDFVVSDQVGSLLRRGQMVETNSRHMTEAFKLCGLQAAVTRKDGFVFVDNHRIEEAELPDARRDLPDLLFGMRSRISGV